MTTDASLSSETAVLAFDVGGTTIKSGIVLADGRIVGLQRIATPRDPLAPGDVVVHTVTDLAAHYRAAHPEWQFQAVGLIVPGLVDERAGVGVYSANLGWRDFPFATRVRSELDLPVAFGHDVGAAGEAEFEIGAARNTDDAIVLVNGTGIAAAVFCDGRRVLGGGYAGELGHAPVPDPDQPARTVILESVGSAAAISARYWRISGNAVDGARDVLLLAQSGDKVAAQVWDQAVQALAFSIAQCVSILGTETVVIGGGLSQAGAALLAPLRLAVDERLSLARPPHIVAALLGENAGLIGAAMRARGLLQR
jgi:glucokinase